MSSHTLRFGILGAARIAPAALIKPARRVDGVEVVAVAARDRGRAQAFASAHGIDRVHETYDDLLDDATIDAVYIPLPNGLHGTWTRRAIQAGKHVLCEKPFAANAREARAIATLAEQADTVVMEAFHWRYHPLNVRLIDAVANGDLGEPVTLDATFCFPLLDPRDIRWSRTLAGGSLMDAGCYPVNMVRAVMAAAGNGEPVVDRATASFTARGVDRAMRGTLRWPTGARGRIRCGMFDPRHPIDIRLALATNRAKSVVRNPLLPHLLGHRVTRTSGRRTVDWAERVTSYDYQLVAFRDAVRDATPFPTTASDAVANMAVIDALYRASGVTPHVPTPSPP